MESRKESNFTMEKLWQRHPLPGDQGQREWELTRHSDGMHPWYKVMQTELYGLPLKKTWLLTNHEKNVEQIPMEGLPAIYLMSSPQNYKIIKIKEILRTYQSQEIRRYSKISWQKLQKGSWDREMCLGKWSKSKQSINFIYKCGFISCKNCVMQM